MSAVGPRCFVAALLAAGLVRPAAAQAPARNDLYGQALPAGAVAGLGAHLYPHPAAFALALSPDGTRLATVSREETRIWETSSAKELHRFTATGTAPSFSANNQRLFLAGPEEAAVWDIATGKELWRTAGRHAVFSPDGKFLAAVSFEPVERSYTVRLVDAHGKEARSFGASPAAPEALAFAGAGDLLAGGCTDGFVRLWDTATGKEVRRFQGHRGAVRSVAFAPGDRQLASASADGTVRLWDPATGKELRQWQEAHELAAAPFLARMNVLVAFAADGTALYAAWKDGTICRVYDPASGAELRQLRTVGNRIGGTQLSRGVFASLNADSLGRSESLVRVWDLNAGQELGPVRPMRELLSVAFAGDGRTVATGCGDKLVYLWDAMSGKPLRQLPGHVAEVKAVAFAPKGHLLASGSTYLDTSVNVWDAATGQKVAQIPGNANGVDRLVFAVDGTLVIGTRSGLVRRWEITAGKELGQYRVPGNVFGLGPEGRFLAHGYRDRQTGKLEHHIVDLTTGQPVRKIPVPDDAAFFWSALAPDAGLIVGYGAPLRPFGAKREQLFDLYDVTTGKELCRFGDFQNELDAAYQPNWVVFSPDGRMIAEAQRARTVRLWELSTGKVRRRLEGHTAQATAAAFAPDGRLLATSGADRRGLIWDIYGLSEGELKLDAAQLQSLWADLADADAPKGLSAVGALARGGAPALAMLKDRLKPVAAPEPQYIARRIAELDAKELADRQKAEEELETAGDAVIAPLRKAWADPKASPEMKQRLERLVQKLEGFPFSSDCLRQSRALEALEVIGTPAAMEAIQSLAEGAPDARLTRAAKASLDRLRRRAAVP